MIFFKPFDVNSEFEYWPLSSFPWPYGKTIVRIKSEILQFPDKMLKDETNRFCLILQNFGQIKCVQ